MHDLGMPLADLVIESGNTWLQKVGIFMMEKIPSSHPMTGKSVVTGMKTTYTQDQVPVTHSELIRTPLAKNLLFEDSPY